MNRVFISYSRNDREFANRLAKSLADVGADVWIDSEDIPAGEKWSTAIQEGLDSSASMLVIITPDAMSSSNVEDEWQYFLDTGKPVIPVLLKAAKMHFQLHRLQYIDFSSQRFGDAFGLLLDELAHKGVPIKVEEVEDTWVYEVRAASKPPKNQAQSITDNSTQETKPSSSRKEASNPTFINHKIKASIAAQVKESPKAKTETKPYLLIGGIMLVLAVLAVAILLLAPLFANFNNADLSDFDTVPPPVALDLEGLEVHDENGDTLYFENILLRQRYQDGDETWLQVYDIDTASYGYLPLDHLPLDNNYLLAFVPFGAQLKETNIRLFTRPDAQASSRTMSVSSEGLVYGFRYDDNGQLWYYVFVETVEYSALGWINDSGQDLNLIGEVPAMAYTHAEADAFWDDGISDYVLTIPSNVLLPILSRHEDVYWVAYYHEDAWQIFWVRGDKLDINAKTAEYLY